MKKNLDITKPRYSEQIFSLHRGSTVCAALKGIWFLRYFGLKTGIDFTHVGLE